MEAMHGQMVNFIEENGKMTKCMVLDNFIGLMDHIIKESMKMINDMDLVQWYGQYRNDIEVIGHME